MSDRFFTYDRIENCVTKNDWELVPAERGKWKLRQKRNHDIETVGFNPTPEAVAKFGVSGSDDS